MDNESEDEHIMPTSEEMAEKELAIIMDDLGKHEAPKEMKDGFTKLYDLYFEKKAKIDELKVEVTALEGKLGERDETYSKLVERFNEDHETIDGFKREAGRAKALADAMHSRELAARETIENLRRQNSKMTAELDLIKATGADEEEEQSDAPDKEKLEKERAKLSLEVEALKSRLKNAVNYQDELERKNSEADMALQRMEEEIEDLTNEATRQSRIRVKMQDEIDDHKKDIQNMNKEISQLQEELSILTAKCAKLERSLHSRKTTVETLRSEAEAAELRQQSLQANLDQTNLNLEKTNKMLADKTKELQNSIDQIAQCKNEIAKSSKTTAAVFQKMAKIERAKVESESERDRLKNSLAAIEREVMLGKRQSEADRKELEKNARDRELQSKAMTKLQVDAQENLAAMNMQTQNRKMLEGKIDQLTSAIGKQRHDITSLETERDRLLEEELALNAKIDVTNDEVRFRDTEIIELQKVIREQIVKYKKQQSGFDAVRSERNLLGKNYAEAQDHIADLRQKQKTLSYQIEQMKEDGAVKERALKVAETELAKAKKKIDDLKAEVQNAAAVLYREKDETKGLKQEERKLTKVILEHEAEISRLVKEREGLLNERDIIGTQLVRRNDELALLYEKIRILQHTLFRGEKHYDQRLEDIRLLKTEIGKLRREKNLQAKGIENMTNLRLEVFNLEREAARERLRVRALEEALQTPLNVHRWRKLQGTDPTMVDLLSKLQILQKKVLRQSEVIVEKERQLKESEKIYIVSKERLSLQPSPEVQSQLSQTQKALTRRGDKLKCLVVELNLKNTQVAECKLEIQRITNELNEIKSKFFAMKKLASPSRSPSQGRADRADGAAEGATPKVFGGGFHRVVSLPRRDEREVKLPEISV